MAKLDIDGVTVYTDDFNEEQLKAYQEIIAITSEMDRLELLTHCLTSRRIQLAPVLLPKDAGETLPEDITEQLGMFEPEDLEPDETETSA